MIRTLTLIVLLFFINLNCSANAPVRVSELGADGFFYNYNDFCSKMSKPNLSIQHKPSLKLSNENYLVYVGNIGKDNLTISLFANMEGYISKIMTACSIIDYNSMADLGESLVVILSVLGVNKGELVRFLDDWKNPQLNEIIHWCSATNRFIIVNRSLNYKLNTLSVTFSAAS